MIRLLLAGGGHRRRPRTGAGRLPFEERLKSAHARGPGRGGGWERIGCWERERDSWNREE